MISKPILFQRLSQRLGNIRWNEEFHQRSSWAAGVWLEEVPQVLRPSNVHQETQPEDQCLGGVQGQNWRDVEHHQEVLLHHHCSCRWWKEGIPRQGGEYIYLYTYKNLIILIVWLIVCLRPCVRILDTK